MLPGCYVGLADLGVSDGNDGAGDAGDGSDSSDSDADPSEPGSEAGIAYSPVSRLTDPQWRNTVRAAFGLDGGALSSISLPADGTDGIFVTNAVDNLGNFDEYVLAAESAGTIISGSLTAQCDWGTNADACTDQWLATPMSVLLRRPLHGGDLAPIRDVIGDALALGRADHEAVAVGVSRALLAPEFLFRLEEPKEPIGADAYSMFGHQLAARLSYTVVDGPPDAEAMAAALDGVFDDAEGYAGEVDRILAQPAARDMIWRFVRDWLGIGYLDSELGESMEHETRLFVEHVLFDDEVPLSDLFLANYTFIDARLAEHYGVPAPAQDWERYELPASAQRVGVLTHASVLTSHASESREDSKIFRGKLLFNRLLCQTLPTPPEGALEMAGEIEDRTTHPACMGCHSVIEPAGQLFHQYDAHGQLYDDDESAWGEIKGGSDLVGEYSGIREFSEALVDSHDAADCFNKTWFQFALGRPVAEQDQQSFERMLQIYRDTGSLRSTLASLLSSPAFTTVYIEDYRNG